MTQAPKASAIITGIGRSPCNDAVGVTGIFLDVSGGFE